MINLDEVNGEIAKLEAQPATYVTIERLAWLYIVRDHITLSTAREIVSETNTGVIPEAGTSDFLMACAGKPIASIMQIMDELMDTTQVLQPRIYNSVLKKVQNL